MEQRLSGLTDANAARLRTLAGEYGEEGADGENNGHNNVHGITPTSNATNHSVHNDTMVMDAPLSPLDDERPLSPLPYKPDYSRPLADKRSDSRSLGLSVGQTGFDSHRVPDTAQLQLGSRLGAPLLPPHFEPTAQFSTSLPSPPPSAALPPFRAPSNLTSSSWPWSFSDSSSSYSAAPTTSFLLPYSKRGSHHSNRDSAASSLLPSPQPRPPLLPFPASYYHQHRYSSRRRSGLRLSSSDEYDPNLQEHDEGTLSDQSRYYQLLLAAAASDRMKNGNTRGQELHLENHRRSKSEVQQQDVGSNADADSLKPPRPFFARMSTHSTSSGGSGADPDSPSPASIPLNTDGESDSGASTPAETVTRPRQQLNNKASVKSLPARMRKTPGVQMGPRRSTTPDPVRTSGDEDSNLDGSSNGCADYGSDTAHQPSNPGPVPRSPTNRSPAPRSTTPTPRPRRPPPSAFSFIHPYHGSFNPDPIQLPAHSRKASMESDKATAAVGYNPAEAKTRVEIVHVPVPVEVPISGSAHNRGSFYVGSPPGSAGLRSSSRTSLNLGNNNAYLSSSAIARYSTASLTDLALTNYAANMIGGGRGSMYNTRSSSIDLGAMGYNLPLTTSTILESSENRAPLREPFLAPTSRASSSVWTPPVPLTSATLSANTGTPGRVSWVGGSTLAGSFMGSGGGDGTGGLVVAKREPLPSSKLGRKLSKSDKPWMARLDPWERRAWWTTVLLLILGVALGGLTCWLGFSGVRKLPRTCIVLDERFDSLNTDTWSRDVELGGFGNGEFQMTTNSDANSYVKNGQLYIMPTLTSDILSGGNDAIFNGANYTLDGCTSNNKTACSVSSNSNRGAVINPVQSARLNTKNSASITYGKVEFRAKLPRGDWLWPAVWMMPVDETYGPWPLSGEIDILEARGNGPSYPHQGNNYVRSSLNWGPLPSLFATTFGWQFSKRSSFADGFHTYTFEWDQHFMRFSVDSKVKRTLEVHMDGHGGGSFWKRGGFPKSASNGTINGAPGQGGQVSVQDPWSGRPNSAPFDQGFYLIIDLAVGGTSGWFPDNLGDKPWFDGSLTAMTEFAKAQDSWYQTWPQNDDDRAFRIDYVKMSQLC